MWRLPHRGVRAACTIGDERASDRRLFTLTMRTTSARALARCVVMMAAAVLTPTRMTLLVHGPFPFRLWTPALGHATPSSVDPPPFFPGPGVAFSCPARSWRRHGRSGVVRLLARLVLGAPFFPSKGRLPMPAGDTLPSTRLWWPLSFFLSFSLSLSFSCRWAVAARLLFLPLLPFALVLSVFVCVFKFPSFKSRPRKRRGRDCARAVGLAVKNTRGTA